MYGQKSLDYSLYYKTAGTSNLESNKNAKGKKCDGNFNDYTVCMAKGYHLWVVLIFWFPLSPPSLLFPSSLHPSPHPLPQFLFSLSIPIIKKYIYTTK